MNWREAWSRHKEPAAAESVLGKLMSVSGAKERFQKVKMERWREVLESHYSLLEIKAGESVYEVGCGAGAWLYPLYENGHRVGGMDFSPALVEIARQHLPDGTFSIGEAIDCTDDPVYDHVVSHATFRYFPDCNYAENVMDAMLKKAKKNIGIFSIHDSNRETEFEAYRKSTHPEGEYERLYKNLRYLYFPVSFFTDFAKKRGLEVQVHKPRENAVRYNVVISC